DLLVAGLVDRRIEHATVAQDVDPGALIEVDHQRAAENLVTVEPRVDLTFDAEPEQLATSADLAPRRPQRARRVAQSGLIPLECDTLGAEADLIRVGHVRAKPPLAAGEDDAVLELVEGLSLVEPARHDRGDAVDHRQAFL